MKYTLSNFVHILIHNAQSNYDKHIHINEQMIMLGQFENIFVVQSI